MQNFLSYYISLLILALLINFSVGYKFFFYSPKFGGSHVIFIGKLADVLAKAGHDVTVYQPILNVNITTTGTKLAKLIERPLDFEVPYNLDQFQDDIWNPVEMDFEERQKALKFLLGSFSLLCENQLNDKKLMDILAKEKWDLALGEMFDPCYYAVLKKIAIKNYITIFAGSIFDVAASHLGIPASPSFLPNMFDPIPPPLSYINRAKNLVSHIMGYNYMSKYFFGVIENVAKPIIGDNFDVLKMLGDSSFVFVNVDEHTDFPRPITHKVIYMGGVGQVEPKSLEKKYKVIMDNSKKGVILVSFGSVAQSYRMLPEQKKVFLETFKEFPDITFIWKYENETDDIAAGFKNVITGKWLPQTDLLDHPKILAFISHGGMNSVTEATARGVPMICIPLFAEQKRNAIIVSYRKVGVSLSKEDLMEGKEKLVELIKTILSDDSYSKNAKRLSAMIKDKPMKPEERFLKYAEFAAKFGFNNNLDMYGRHLNTIEYYCLDIIIPAIGSVLLLLYIIFWAVKKVVKKIFYMLSGNKKSKME